LKFVLLFALAALWALVLIPPLLRARTSRSSDSIGDFNYRLGVLSRTGGFSRRRAARRQLPALSSPMAPRTTAAVPVYAPSAGMYGSRPTASQRAAKRRRDITLGLVVAAVVSLAVAAVAQSSSVWFLQVLVDLLLVGYVGLCAWFRSTPMARGSRVAVGNVQYLAEHRSPELALQTAPVVLRRTGSS
jgi:hypothetical protein